MELALWRALYARGSVIVESYNLRMLDMPGGGARGNAVTTPSEVN